MFYILGPLDVGGGRDGRAQNWYVILRALRFAQRKRFVYPATSAARPIEMNSSLARRQHWTFWTSNRMSAMLNCAGLAQITQF